MLTNNPENILGKVVQLVDPNTKVPIPGNIIPPGLLSPNGLGILKAYPQADIPVGSIGGTSNYYVTALHPQDQRKDTLAVDMNLTDKQRLQFRRNNYAFFEYQPLDGTPTETPKYFNRPNQTNSLDYVWTISPNKVNEVLATVSLDDVYIPVDTAHFFDRTTAGINYPYIFPTGKLIPTRIPTANITGLTGLTGNPYPSHSTGPIYTITDSFTWVKGSHTFKFGMYYEKIGRERQRRNQRLRLPDLHQQPERTIRFHRHPFGSAQQRQRHRQRRAWACSIRTPNLASAPTRSSVDPPLSRTRRIRGRSARS